MYKILEGIKFLNPVILHRLYCIKLVKLPRLMEIE